MNDGSAFGSLILLLLPLLLIGFLLWSTRRRQRAIEQFSAGLSTGEQVVLTSGIYGTIVELGETTCEVEVAPGTILTVDRRAVGVRAADLAQRQGGAADEGSTETSTTGTSTTDADDPQDGETSGERS